jgi:hypothetical protein
MGFELNKLMRQSGVSTPGVVNYSGPAAPVIPVAPTGERPTGEDDAAKAKQTAYDKQLADANAYKADPTAFNEMARKYNLAQKEYDQYRTAYTGRLMNTPQYSDAQFQTGPSAGMAYATKEGGIGADKYNQNIRDWVTKNPTATPQAFRAEMDKYGVSGYDAAQARGGSMWGTTPLSMPTYGAVPLSLGSKTQQEKTDYYNNLRGLGYTDADIRGSAESSFGKIPDADWNVLSGNTNTAGTTTAGTNNAGIIQSTNDLLKNLNIGGDFSNVDFKNLNLAGGGLNVNGPWSVPGVNTMNRAQGGSVYDLEQKYADGGAVKTHYRTAGPVKLPSGYGSEEEEADFARRFFTPSSDVTVSPVDMSVPPPPVTTDLQPPPAPAPTPEPALTKIAIDNVKNVSEPVAPTVAPVAPVAAAPMPSAAPSDRVTGIQALLATYGPKDSAYGEDLKAARASAKAESDAFAKMLAASMKSPEDEKSSKAEIYFRLASAFGAPTKTGQFSENLGMVGKELGEYTKGKRASAQQKLALALEGQKMKMSEAKENLKSLQILAGEEMKDKRTIATELIKDYIKSGEPQSAAGKQARDEGLKPGTPEYQRRVEAIGNLNVEGRMAQIAATLANVQTAGANLNLAQEKFINQKAQQAKLSPAEVKLKTETEDTLAQTDSALGILRQAFALNPNTFDTSISDMAQRKALEVTNSKHPKVVATREQENLLEKAALAQLKSTFPGAISNDERKALQDVQGLGAKSIEERARIMKNAYKALQSVSERHRKRLADINQGVYRDAGSSIDGGND